MGILHKGNVYRWFDVAAFFMNWHSLSLGVHIDLLGPFVEIHFLFGYCRVGWFYFSRDEFGGWSCHSGSNWRKKAQEKIKIKLGI